MCGATPSSPPLPCLCGERRKNFHPTVPNLIPQFHYSVLHFTGAFKSVVCAVTLLYSNTSSFVDFIPMKQQKKSLRCMRFLTHCTNKLWGLQGTGNTKYTTNNVWKQNLHLTVTFANTRCFVNSKWFIYRHASKYQFHIQHGACVFCYQRNIKRTYRFRHYQAFLIKAASLRQCFSTAGPWHQLYRAARSSPGICHFIFLSNFHE